MEEIKLNPQATEIENVYRDGYLAGASSVFDAVKREVDSNRKMIPSQARELIHFKRLEGYMERLWKWRFKEPKDRMIYPPKINT